MIRDRNRMNAICAFYENKKLDENEHKGDWKDESIEGLWNNICEEYEEAWHDVTNYNFELAKLELADLINTSKMLLEKLHDECSESTETTRVRALK